MWCKYSSFQAHADAVPQMIVEQWGVLPGTSPAGEGGGRGGEFRYFLEVFQNHAEGISSTD